MEKMYENTPFCQSRLSAGQTTLGIFYWQNCSKDYRLAWFLLVL
jgi:hypothetical protein